MDQLTTILLTKALDGLALRSAAISQNVANANSPGYEPVRVSFESELAAAAGNGADAVRDVQPKIIHQSQEGAAQGVRLDLELADASKTALRYNALVDILNRQMQLARLSIQGGRR
ncbi:MAG TPA: hypothetical protein VGA34_07660 [Alteraurantiacibacter sp.]